MPLSIIIQHLLPKQVLTSLAGKLANLEGGWITLRVIAWFVTRYGVNMQEAANADIASYPTFNQFFTRPLKAGARPLAKVDFICPVDGAISQFGEIKTGQIFQAKGHEYSTLTLLAGNQALADRFANGLFTCLYLSPRDYHRIHMPCDGILQSMAYVPGDLFSVNPITAQNIPNLFARNERVVCEFTSKKHGAFVLVLVGATIVGSMATVWHGVVNPPRRGRLQTWDYHGQNITLKQGDEMGKFLLGSTVVALFEQGRFTFNPTWQSTKPIKLGEAMSQQ